MKNESNKISSDFQVLDKNISAIDIDIEETNNDQNGHYVIQHDGNESIFIFGYYISILITN